ncbi:sugar transferase [Marinibacterium sp. SX1]|uniref:sugar transferase n=1 Tax=Marinibacterium sp. SX1 TaxID=3388424 RepID=UPI003D165208
MTNFEFEGHSSDAEMSRLGASDGGSRRFLGIAGKRLFDIGFALVAILTFSPLMIVIALVMKATTRGPLFFCHERVGEGHRSFRCMKFRTMVVDAQEQLELLLSTDPEARAEFEATRKLRKDPRIIPYVGEFLRKTSLDELPQFFNVLMGHMSIVGPRPVTKEEFDAHYGADHPYVVVRPGITGLWQVSGRNDVTYAERVRLDSEYVDNQALGLDFWIILQTVFIVCLDRNGH